MTVGVYLSRMDGLLDERRSEGFAGPAFREETDESDFDRAGLRNRSGG